MQRLLLPLLALCVLGTPAQAKDEPAPRPEQEENSPYPPEFHARVNRAVDQGVEWLISRQAADGSWPAPEQHLVHRPGTTALMTLAVLKGGIKGSDLSVRKAFDWLRRQEVKRTYDAGVLLMALHARYSPLDGDEEAEYDKYGARKLKDPCQDAMPKEDREWMERLVRYLLEHESGGHWRYPHDGTDLSNTQYALLGLWAAARCGIKVPRALWERCLAWLLSVQEARGRPVKLHVNEVRGNYRMVWLEDAQARGFRYMPNYPVTGAMTTAGLAGLVICRDELWGSREFTPEQRTRTRRAIRDALGWMQDAFDVTKNPGEPQGGWHFYYLYGMERAGVLSRFRFMGTHDWYLEGAEWLLGQQGSSGRWEREHTVLDTAFAVLFLKRSSQRARNPVLTPSGG